MANLSPLVIVAGLGLLKGGGLSVSRALTSITGSFESSGITGAVQSRIGSELPSVVSSLSRIPSFLSGMIPAGISGLSGTSLTGALTTQASSLLNKGTAGFISIFGQASSHAASSFGFSGALAQARGMTFDDLGFNFKNITDVATCGISHQFNTDALPAFGGELSKLGTLFDVKNLYHLPNPWVMANNLIAQGLGNIGGISSYIQENNIDTQDIDNIDDYNTAQLFSIFESITGSDLDEIFVVTSFDTDNLNQIETLKDVFDINNLFTDEALAALGPDPTLDTLSNKLTNLGGKFPTLSSLGLLLTSIEVPTLTADSFNSLISEDLIGDTDSLFGSGTGPFGNPTVADLVGSASGNGYTDDIESAKTAQDDLLAYDDDVQYLHNYIASSPTLDPTVLDSLITNVNGKSGLQDIIREVNASMINVASRLSTEIRNLSIAGVDLTAASSPSALMNMCGQMHGLGVDPMGLGLGHQLSLMATADKFGEALKASLVEGKNLGKLAVFGIDPNTKMDPVAYASKLRGMYQPVLTETPYTPFY